ncbi:MAG: hypothetical protein ACWGMZ_09545, partial [Thermoguttaceae bacterium]
AGFTFSELMFAERKAAMLSGRQGQAQATAESGLQMLRMFLSKDVDDQKLLGGCYNNPSQFRGVLVTDDEIRFYSSGSKSQHGRNFQDRR